MPDNITGLPGYQNTRGPGGDLYQGGRRTSPDDFGASNWNDIARLGEVGQRFFNMQTSFAVDRENQQQADLAAEMSTQYEVDLSSQLSEIRQLEGKNAFNSKSILSEYEAKVREKYDVSKEGTIAARLYKRNTDQAFARAQAQVDQHISEQRTVYTKQNIGMMLEKVNKEVSANPGSFVHNLPRMEDAVRQAGHIQGWSKTQTDNELEKAYVGLGEAAITSLVMEGGPEAAEGFLNSQDWYKDFANRVGPARVKALFGNTVASIKAEAVEARQNKAKDIVFGMAQDYPGMLRPDGTRLSSNDFVKEARARIESEGIDPNIVSIEQILSTSSAARSRDLANYQMSRAEEAAEIDFQRDRYLANYYAGQVTIDDIFNARTDTTVGEQYRGVISAAGDQAIAEINNALVTKNAARTQVAANVLDSAVTADTTNVQNLVNAGDGPALLRHLKTLVLQGDDRELTEYERSAVINKQSSLFGQRADSSTAASKAQVAEEQATVALSASAKASRAIAIEDEVSQLMSQNPNDWQTYVLEDLKNSYGSGPDYERNVAKLRIGMESTRVIDEATASIQNYAVGKYYDNPELLRQKLSSDSGLADLYAEVGHKNGQVLIAKNAQNNGVSNQNVAANKDVSVMDSGASILGGYFLGRNADAGLEDEYQRKFALYRSFVATNLQSYDTGSPAERDSLIQNAVRYAMVGGVTENTVPNEPVRTTLTQEQLGNIDPSFIRNSVPLVPEMEYAILDEEVRKEATEAFLAEERRYVSSGVSGGQVPLREVQEYNRAKAGKSLNTRVAEWVRGEYPFRPETVEQYSSLVDQVVARTPSYQGAIPEVYKNSIEQLRRINNSEIGFVETGRLSDPTFEYVQAYDGTNDVIQTNLPIMSLHPAIVAWANNNGYEDAQFTKSLNTGAFIVYPTGVYSEPIRIEVSPTGEIRRY